MNKLLKTDKTIPDDIAELLESEAARINCEAFIVKDPVQFPRRFNRLQDIEIVAFLASLIAWGNRKMICRNMERMLDIMGNEPYLYTMDEGYENVEDDRNLHRTFFGRQFKYLLRGFRKIYQDYGSLDDFIIKEGIGKEDAPAWKLVAEMQKIMSSLNRGEVCPRCLPMNLETTALKRINMALRWLVRDDGKVDMGVWKSIPKSKLFIPLDIHVGNVSRELGILTRKADDRKSVVELTDMLKQLRPEDPVYYDFALFGIGVERAHAGISS